MIYFFCSNIPTDDNLKKLQSSLGLCKMSWDSECLTKIIIVLW